MAAKVTFTKFNKKEEIPVTLVEYEGVKFGVKEKLSTEEIMNLEKEILSLLVDDSFLNPTKFNIYYTILFVKYISTITFTDAQISKSIYQTYDIITKPQGLLIAILQDGKCESCFWSVRTDVEELVENFMKFKSSFIGSMITMNEQKALNIDLNSLLQEVKSPEIKEMLKTLQGQQSENIVDFPSK